MATFDQINILMHAISNPNQQRSSYPMQILHGRAYLHATVWPIAAAKSRLQRPALLVAVVPWSSHKLAVHSCNTITEQIKICPAITGTATPITSQSQSQSHIATDSQSCLGVEPKSGTFNQRFFFSKFLSCPFWGALSDERSCLLCVSLCH
jgi:hypothetical protein